MESADEHMSNDGGPSKLSEISKQTEHMLAGLKDYEDTSAGPPSISAYPTSRDRTPLPRTYRYDRLASSTAIRLIDLDPAADDADILRCRLESVGLEQVHEKYDVLSYVWGQARLSSCLYVEGKDSAPDLVLRVTTNLASALRRLRSNDKSKRRQIWADVVCIDQENDREKAMQVDMMAKIYQRARCVCVHLGSGVPELENCVGFFRSVLSYAMGPNRNEFAAYDVSANNAVIRLALRHTFDTSDPRAVIAFLDLPWFKRRWIVQEAASRCAVIFLYGRSVISRAHLSLAMLRFQNQTFITDVDSQASLELLALIKGLQALVTQGQAFAASGILHLLVRCHALKCSDDRDKVYALLRCATDVEGSITNNSEPCIQIDADYKRTPAELYTALAQKCVQGQVTLDILNWAGAFNPGPPALGLPSWVPHWDGTLRYKPFLGYSRFVAGVFAASPVNRPRIEGLVLHASGYSIDRVQSFRRCLPPDPGDMDSVVEYLAGQAEFLRSRYRKMFAYDRYTASSVRSLALCLIADCVFLDEDGYLGTYEEALDDVEEAMDDVKDALLLALPMLGMTTNNPGQDPDSEHTEEPAGLNRSRNLYLSMVCRTMRGRAFFITGNGHIGVAPDDLAVGDHIAVLHGCRTPLILRKDELLDEFYIIGDAYVDGFMKGEAIKLPKEHLQDFVIC